MNLFDYLDKIRKKPEGYRRGIVFGGTLLIMSLIAMLWFTVFYFLPNSESAPKKIDFSPFDVIKDTFRNFYESIR